MFKFLSILLVILFSKMYSSSYFNIFAIDFITLVRISHAGKIISNALVKVLIFIKSSLIFLMEILFVGTSKLKPMVNGLPLV